MVAQITPLPTPPQRNDPANFGPRGDVFMAAMPTFAAEANVLAQEANQAAVTATEQAVIAATKASEAADSAQAAADSEDAAALNATAAADIREDVAQMVEHYQGVLAADPALNKDGAPLVAGDWYLNSGTGYLRAFNGAEWVQGLSVVAGVSSLNGEVGALQLKTIQGLGLIGEGDIEILPPVAGGEGKALILEPSATPGDPPVPVWGEIDGRPGEVRRTSEKLLPPKWLRTQTQYLRSAYPLTARRYIASPPNTLVAQATLSGGAGDLKKLGLSPDGKDLIVLCSQSPVLRVYREASGGLTQVSINTQPVSQTSQIEAVGPISFSADGNYFCIGINSNNGSSIYDNAVCIYKKEASGWVKKAELRTPSSATYTAVKLSSDASQLFVSMVVGDIFTRYLFNGTTLTATPNPCDFLPPVGKRSRSIDISDDGSVFAMSFDVSSASELTSAFPGYAVYDVGLDGIFRKRAAAPITLPGIYSINVSKVQISPDAKRLAILIDANSGSDIFYRLQYLDLTAAPMSVLAIDMGSGGQRPKEACFLSQDPYAVWVGEGSADFIFIEDEIIGALKQVYKTTANSFIAVGAGGERASRSLLGEWIVRIQQNSPQFSIPELLAAPAAGVPDQYFYTYLRSYDA